MLLTGGLSVTGSTSITGQQNIITFLENVLNHFPQQPVHFVYDNHDLEQNNKIFFHSVQHNQSNPYLFLFASLTAPEKWMVKGDERILVLISVSTRTDKEELKTLASNGGMKRGVWLLPHDLVDKDAVLARFDSSVYLYSFDKTLSSASLYEIFAIKEKNKFFNAVGEWTKSGGLHFKIPHMWERRMGFLRGVVLRGAHLECAPFTFLSEKNGTRKAHGIIPDIFEAFQVLHLVCTLANIKY